MLSFWPKISRDSVELIDPDYVEVTGSPQHATFVVRTDDENEP
jgi:hypothetical protein